jgi:hypothetical protein
LSDDADQPANLGRAFLDTRAGYRCLTAVRLRIGADRKPSACGANMWWNFEMEFLQASEYSSIKALRLQVKTVGATEVS